ncbi:MAG: TetR/AcrR family transcriptional regulator [Actinomycetota bacterium]
MSEPTSREKLLRGMSRSLRSRGYGATSMKELLEVTGVSSGSMYHSFPGGKEELAAAAIRDSGLRGAEAIRQVFDDAAGAAEGVGRIFRALVRDLERFEFEFGCPIGVPAAEASASSPAIRAACNEIFHAWVDAYRDALTADGWPEVEATAQALAIVTAYEGSITIARAIEDTTPIANTAADLIARIEAGSRSAA